MSSDIEQEATITVRSGGELLDVSRDQSTDLKSFVEAIARYGAWVNEGTCFIPAAQIERIYLKVEKQPDLVDVLESSLGRR